MTVKLFYDTFNERYNIRVRKLDGCEVLTSDPIFQEWYFCNSYREHDKVTEWFRENMRTRYGGKYDLFATIAFRVFNWPQSGQTLIDNDLILNWDLETAVAEINKQDQVISGAYILKGHTCGSKVRGLAMIADEVYKDLDYHYEKMMEMTTLEDQYNHLLTIPFIGRFTGYQKMQDLKFTHIGEKTEDWETWAVAGPGAVRGLNRMNGRPVDHRSSKVDYHREILLIREVMFNYTNHHLTASDVQHWLCEYDKYNRIKDGGKMKRRYR